MVEPVESLKQLAADAVEVARQDRRARRCWPWSHDWSRWEVVNSGRQQTRACLGCGKMQRHILMKECSHEWIVTRKINIFRESVSLEIPVGFGTEQLCTRCGTTRVEKHYA